MRKETNHTHARKNTEKFARRQIDPESRTKTQERKLKLVQRAAIGLVAIALFTLVSFREAAITYANQNSWEETHYAACSTQKDFAQAACYADTDLQRIKKIAERHEFEGKVYIDLNLKHKDKPVAEVQGQTIELGSDSPDLALVDSDLRLLESLDWSDPYNTVFLYIVLVKHPRNMPTVTITESSVSSYQTGDVYASNFSGCQIDDGGSNLEMYEIGDPQVGSGSRESDGVKQHYFNTSLGPQGSYEVNLGHHSLENFQLCFSEMTNFTKSRILSWLAKQPLNK